MTGDCLICIKHKKKSNQLRNQIRVMDIYIHTKYKTGNMGNKTNSMAVSTNRTMSYLKKNVIDCFHTVP